MRYDRRGFKPMALAHSAPDRQGSPADPLPADLLISHAFISAKNAVDLKLYALFLALGTGTGGPLSLITALLRTVGRATRLIKQSRAGPIAGRSD